VIPDIYNAKRPGEIPKGAVVVDRSTPWGNPYIVQLGESTRASICAQFETYATERHAREPQWLAPLVGKDLVCHCRSPNGPKRQCHAQTLLRLANGYDRTDGAYWFSCRAFTARVAVNSGRILRNGTAPIVLRFVGQSPKALGDWVRRRFGEEPLVERLPALPPRAD
jgi:hypothetical protein